MRKRRWPNHLRKGLSARNANGTAMNTTPNTAMYRFLSCTVAQYMTSTVRTVGRNITLRELEALFAEYDFNAFPVVEEGRILGIVTKFDFIRAFAFTTHQMVPHFDELMSRT